MTDRVPDPSSSFVDDIHTDMINDTNGHGEGGNQDVCIGSESVDRVEVVGGSEVEVVPMPGCAVDRGFGLYDGSRDKTNNDNNDNDESKNDFKINDNSIDINNKIHDDSASYLRRTSIVGKRMSQPSVGTVGERRPSRLAMRRSVSLESSTTTTTTTTRPLSSSSAELETELCLLSALNAAQQPPHHNTMSMISNASSSTSTSTSTTSTSTSSSAGSFKQCLFPSVPNALPMSMAARRSLSAPRMEAVPEVDESMLSSDTASSSHPPPSSSPPSPPPPPPPTLPVHPPASDDFSMKNNTVLDNYKQEINGAVVSIRDWVNAHRRMMLALVLLIAVLVTVPLVMLFALLECTPIGCTADRLYTNFIDALNSTSHIENHIHSIALNESSLSSFPNVKRMLNHIGPDLIMEWNATAVPGFDAFNPPSFVPPFWNTGFYNQSMESTHDPIVFSTKLSSQPVARLGKSICGNLRSSSALFSRHLSPDLKNSTLDSLAMNSHAPPYPSYCCLTPTYSPSVLRSYMGQDRVRAESVTAVLACLLMQKRMVGDVLLEHGWVAIQVGSENRSDVSFVRGRAVMPDFAGPQTVVQKQRSHGVLEGKYVYDVKKRENTMVLAADKATISTFLPSPWTLFPFGPWQANVRLTLPTPSSSSNLIIAPAQDPDHSYELRRSDGCFGDYVRLHGSGSEMFNLCVVPGQYAPSIHVTQTPALVHNEPMLLTIVSVRMQGIPIPRAPVSLVSGSLQPRDIYVLESESTWVKVTMVAGQTEYVKSGPAGTVTFYTPLPDLGLSPWSIQVSPVVPKNAPSTFAKVIMGAFFRDLFEKGTFWNAEMKFGDVLKRLITWAAFTAPESDAKKNMTFWNGFKLYFAKHIFLTANTSSTYTPSMNDSSELNGPSVQLIVTGSNGVTSRFVLASKQDAEAAVNVLAKSSRQSGLQGLYARILSDHLTEIRNQTAVTQQWSLVQLDSIKMKSSGQDGERKRFTEDRVKKVSEPGRALLSSFIGARGFSWLPFDPQTLTTYFKLNTTVVSVNKTEVRNETGTVDKAVKETVDAVRDEVVAFLKERQKDEKKSEIFESLEFQARAMVWMKRLETSSQKVVDDLVSEYGPKVGDFVKFMRLWMNSTLIEQDKKAFDPFGLYSATPQSVWQIMSTILFEPTAHGFNVSSCDDPHRCDRDFFASVRGNLHLLLSHHLLHTPTLEMYPDRRPCFFVDRGDDLSECLQHATQRFLFSFLDALLSRATHQDATPQLSLLVLYLTHFSSWCSHSLDSVSYTRVAVSVVSARTDPSMFGRLVESLLLLGPPTTTTTSKDGDEKNEDDEVPDTRCWVDDSVATAAKTTDGGGVGMTYSDEMSGGGVSVENWTFLARWWW